MCFSRKQSKEGDQAQMCKGMTEKAEWERIKQMKEDGEGESASEKESTNGKTWRRGAACTMYAEVETEVEEDSSIYRHSHHGAPAPY